MAATTTAKITSLITSLQSSDYFTRLPYTVTIERGMSFSWSYENRTITYDPHDKDVEVLLLHEAGHAVLDHHNYIYDVHLLEMERAAWDKARELASMLKVRLPHATIETALDTYRDWLHARSLCPRCGSTGVQEGQHAYTCLACHREWHVNEARTCQLRRYTTKKRP